MEVKKAARANQYTRRTYKFNGKNLTVTEWSKETGINRYTINQRMRNGWPLKNVLTNVPYEVTYAYKGKKRTLTQWAKHLGINKTTLRNRFKSGWPISKALASPARTKKITEGKHH